MWVVNLDEVLPIARLPEGQLRRAVLTAMCQRGKNRKVASCIFVSDVAKRLLIPGGLAKHGKILALETVQKKRVAEEIVALTRREANSPRL